MSRVIFDPHVYFFKCCHCNIKLICLQKSNLLKESTFALIHDPRMTNSNTWIMPIYKTIIRSLFVHTFLDMLPTSKTI